MLRFDEAECRERLSHGLGSLREELAGLGPERTSGEPPGVLHTS